MIAEFTEGLVVGAGIGVFFGFMFGFIVAISICSAAGHGRKQ